MKVADEIPLMRAHCAHSLSLYALLISVSMGKKKAVGFASLQLQLGFHFCSRHRMPPSWMKKLGGRARRTCMLKAFTHAMHAVAQALGLGLLSFNTSNQQSTSKHTTYTQPYTIIRKYETLTGTFRGYAHIKKSNAMKT